MRLQRILTLIVCVALPALAAAQQLRGTVADSASRFPISSAVVTVLDSAGSLLARSLSNDRGAFSVSWLPRSHRLRVVRIGFRPREILLSGTSGASPIAIAMFPLPTMLEPARVDAKQCPKRADSQQALGLWEQVRAGLLATIVAREQNPGSLVVLSYSRHHEGLDDATRLFKVTRESTARSLNSYKAVYNAADFVRLGFAAGELTETRDYYAPDADVLIDGGFAAGYCFRIVRGDRTRPNEVGLGFASPDRRPGRVDIEGALWVDTLARAIRDIDFRYIGIHPRVDNLGPGGNIAFREMPNGQTLIDRWHIRMIGAQADSVTMRNSFFSVVGGGELAHARWPDSTRFDAELGSATITARTPSGQPATGRKVALANTPYAATLDASGVFNATDLLPGPYWLVMPEPRLSPLLLDSIPSRLTFEAKRGTALALNAEVPTLEDWVRQRCASDARLSPTDTTLVLARLTDMAGQPIARASVMVEAQQRNVAGRSWVVIRDGGRTGADGLFQVCTSRFVPPVPRMRVSGRLPDGEPYVSEFEVSFDDVNLFRITIPRVVRP